MKGSSINNWRWLADSSGVAFLERMAGGHQRLVLALIGNRTIEPLTSTNETVKAFDVLDRRHYVYTVADAAGQEQIPTELHAPSIVGTGHPLMELLFPNSLKVSNGTLSAGDYLWAVAGNKRFKVTHGGAPILLSGEIVLSPDGSSATTALLVPEVPPSWEQLYPPPYESDTLPNARRARVVHQYVRINLRTGAIESLTDAPVQQ